MPPTDGSPASDTPTDSGTAPVVAPAAQDFQNPNELGTELTIEQEQALVNETLGLGTSNHEAIPAAPKAGEDQSGDTENVEGQKPAAPVEPEPIPTPSPVQEEEPKPAPAPADTTVDTSDLWLEVEDSEGKSVKITLADGIPDDFTFKNDKQLYEVLDSMQEMKTILKEREADVATKLAEADKAQTTEQAQAARLAAWDTEIETLQSSGLIKETKPPADGKGYTPEEIAANPGLTQIKEVFDYMTAQNKTRLEEGKAPIDSFGTAFTLMTNDIAAKAAEEATAAENAKAKAAASLIGGTSSTSGSGDAANYYKAGSASSIWNVKIPD